MKLRPNRPWNVGQCQRLLLDGHWTGHALTSRPVSRATASPKVIQSFSAVLLGKTFKKLFQLDRKTVKFIYRITARGAEVIIFKRVGFALAGNNFFASQVWG